MNDRLHISVARRNTSLHSPNSIVPRDHIDNLLREGKHTLAPLLRLDHRAEVVHRVAVYCEHALAPASLTLVAVHDWQQGVLAVVLRDGRHVLPPALREGHVLVLLSAQV